MSSISDYRRYAGPQWYARQTARASRRGPGPEAPAPPKRPDPPKAPLPPEVRPHPGRAPGKNARPAPRPSPHGKAGGDFSRALSKLLPEGLDSGDLFLAAMLLFLYSESHDEDFLIILIVVGVSIFHKGREDS